MPFGLLAVFMLREADSSGHVRNVVLILLLVGEPVLRRLISLGPSLFPACFVFGLLPLPVLVHPEIAPSSGPFLVLLHQEARSRAPRRRANACLGKSQGSRAGSPRNPWRSTLRPRNSHAKLRSLAHPPVGSHSARDAIVRATCPKDLSARLPRVLQQCGRARRTWAFPVFVKSRLRLSSTQDAAVH